MSDIVIDFEHHPSNEIHTYMKEIKSYMYEFFQTQPQLNHPEWKNWLDSVKVHYRTDELSNICSKNMACAEKGFNAFLKIGARFLPRHSWYRQANAMLDNRRQYLDSLLDFAKQSHTSMIFIDQKKIFMLNYVDGHDGTEHMIKAPGIDNKKYFDYVFFHELGHALLYDFNLVQNQKMHVNLAGLYLLSQMLEKAENSTLKTPLKNTQFSLHEAFSDLVGLYMMYHKNDADKEDFFPVYRLFTTRKRGAQYGKDKVHDTTHALDYLIDNMDLLKKDFNSFINDAIAISIAITYEKLQQNIDSHPLMYNLARRVISENYDYLYDLGVNEKVVEGQEFLDIVAHRHYDQHLQASNYDMQNTGILLDYILQQNHKEIIRLKALPDLSKPASYDTVIEKSDNQDVNFGRDKKFKIA